MPRQERLLLGCIGCLLGYADPVAQPTLVRPAVILVVIALRTTWYTCFCTLEPLDQPAGGAGWPCQGSVGLRK